MSIRVACLCALALALLPGFAARLYYTGAINHTLALQMDLTIEAAKVSGHYAYDSVGAEIELTGARQGGAVTMTEKVDDKATGSFTGTLSADLRAFTGAWTSADGKRKLPFALNAVAAYTTVTVKKKWFDLAGTYPVFYSTAPAWTKLNAQLAHDVKQIVRNFEKDNPHDLAEIPGFQLIYLVDIAYYHPDLASLRITNFWFTGGAHPNTNFSAENYRMSEAKPELLGLRDLFRSANPQAALFPLVQADLQRQTKARDVEMWDYFAAKDLSVYTIAPSGITFHFEPYVVSYYAAGTFEVTLPYAKILPEVNWNGPLRLFLEIGGPGTKAGVDPVTGLDGAGAAKLGLDAFYQRYVKATGYDDHNAVEWMDRQAQDTYAALKNDWNDEQAASLPAAQAEFYRRACNVMGDLASAHYALGWTVDGGTMLLDFAASTSAESEDILGNIIESLRHPEEKDAKARAQAQTNIVAADKTLAARPKSITKPDAFGDPKDYPAQLRALQKAVADAKTLIITLPDHAAALLAAFTLEMAKTPYPDMEEKQ